MSIALAPSRTGLYLYGITVADHVVRSFSGVGGADVEFIVEGSLAAVVSQLGTGKVRPQRANLAAHHRILHELAEQWPVLPVAFGTITRDEEQLRRVLRRNREALAGLLERLRGKVEMGLKVYWDLPTSSNTSWLPTRNWRPCATACFGPAGHLRLRRKSNWASGLCPCFSRPASATRDV